MSDAGATDRLCKDFKMCKSDPIDSEAIVNYVSFPTTLFDLTWKSFLTSPRHFPRVTMLKWAVDLSTSRKSLKW